MEDFLNIEGKTYEFPAEGKVRMLDAAMLQAARSLAELEATTEQLDRMLPRDVASEVVEPIKLASMNNLMEKMKSLVTQTGEQLASAADAAHGLVDNPALSEEAQSATLQKLVDLNTRYDAVTKKMEVVGQRLKLPPPPPST
ncbi:MAG TPA: hypothetical protein PK109_03005 [Candidatus Paceibacterota bacterium]|nr:hypothetical protein [Candidatus Paceibacterota bacterium]